MTHGPKPMSLEEETRLIKRLAWEMPAAVREQFCVMLQTSRTNTRRGILALAREAHRRTAAALDYAAQVRQRLQAAADQQLRDDEGDEAEDPESTPAAALGSPDRILPPLSRFPQRRTGG